LVKIKYLAHACFLITAADGTRIITDPYDTTEHFRHGEIHETAEVVTVSHEHFDHNNAAAISGNPVIIRKSAKVRGIDFTAVPGWHDDAGGQQRGRNTMFCFEVDGIRVGHLGDVGHVLTEAQIAGLGRVDVLLVPVGGFFTIDAAAATEVCRQLNPRVIIPMHFWTEWGLREIAGVGEFLRGKTGVEQLDTSEVEFGPLPETTRITVLKPLL
jgi:L-ascorbate metabolism protein UlaG (beta-lactamase superfamily)